MNENLPYVESPAVEAWVESGMEEYAVLGDITVERGMLTNTPGDTTPQLNAATASFTNYDTSQSSDTTASQMPWLAADSLALGNFVEAYASLDGKTVPLFRGFVDETSGTLGSPEVEVKAMEPVDVLDATFTSPAFVSEQTPVGNTWTWMGEQEDLLGNWDRRLWADPTTSTLLDSQPYAQSTLFSSLSAKVPLLRALRRAGIGEFPSIEPGKTIASVPFDGGDHLNPEFGAYIQRYDKNSITYGLTFNGWDKVKYQNFEIFFMLKTDNSKITFCVDNGAGTDMVAVSVGWNGSNFVLTNDITGEKQILTGSAFDQPRQSGMWNPYEPGGSYAPLSLVIKRFWQQPTQVVLSGEFDSNLNRPITAALLLPQVNKGSTWGFSYNGDNNSYPPFSTVSSSTGNPMAGVMQIRFTRDSSNSKNSWGFGGFMVRQLGDVVATTEDTLAATFKSTLNFGDIYSAAVDFAAATPSFEGETVKDILSTWSQAMCTSVWRDINGKLHIQPPSFLATKSSITGSPPLVKTSSEWLEKSVHWSTKVEDLKKNTTIKFSTPQIARSAGALPTLTVAQAENPATAAPGQVLTWTYVPKDGEEWLGVGMRSGARNAAFNSSSPDTGFSTSGQPQNSSVYAQKNDAKKSKYSSPWNYVNVLFYRNGMNGVRVKATNNSDVNMMYAGQQGYIDPADGSTKYFLAATPIIRAHTVINWSDASRSFLTTPMSTINDVTGTNTPDLQVCSPNSNTGWTPADDGSISFGGGGGGGVGDSNYQGPSEPYGNYEHQGGWEIGALSGTSQTNYFNYLQKQMSTVLHTIETQIHPDARLELGDAISLLDLDSGTTIATGRITYIKNQVSNGKWEQTIRVLSFADTPFNLPSTN